MRPREIADSQDRWLPSALLGPVLVAVFVLVIAPLAWGLRLSVTDSRMIGLGFDIGLTLKNYKTVLADPDTWNAVWVTTVFSGGTVIGSVAVGIAAALVLDREFVGRGLVRVLVILPWAVPHVVAALVWQWMYNPDFGVINYGLLLLPWVDETPKWLSDPDFALLAIILVNVWITGGRIREKTSRNRVTAIRPRHRVPHHAVEDESLHNPIELPHGECLRS